MKDKKVVLRLKRHKRILLSLKAQPDRPRLVVYRSLKNMQAQIVDMNNKVIISLSTLNKEIKQKFPYAGNIKAAAFLGEAFGQKAKEKGIKRIIFDRAGYLYHGRVKAFAEGLRKQGLEF